MSFHFFLSATNSLHLLTPSTLRSLSTSSFHLFLGLLLVPSRSWVKIFWASYPPPFSLGDLTSLSFALLSILLYFLLCTSLLVLSVLRLFHSPFSYLGPYILLNISLSKIIRTCFSFLVHIEIRSYKLVEKEAFVRTTFRGWWSLSHEVDYFPINGT